ADSLTDAVVMPIEHRRWSRELRRSRQADVVLGTAPSKSFSLTMWRGVGKGGSCFGPRRGGRGPRRGVALPLSGYASGRESMGGAGVDCRLLGEGLLAWFDVEVLTTCASDYLTWRNHYPQGVVTINGVTVRRFESARHRAPNLDRWWQRWGAHRQLDRRLLL